MIIAHLASVAAAAGWLALSARLHWRARTADGAAGWAAAGLHALSLAAQWAGAPRLDFGMTASLFMLTAAAAGWPLTRGQREARILLAALAGLAALAPILFRAERPPPSPELLAHLLPAMLAYAFALVALAQFVNLQVAENRLKSGKMEKNAPPILALESACFRSVAAAFGLLTLTLATGAIWGKPMWGAWWVWDARLTSELILLLLYLGFIGLQAAIPDRNAAEQSGAMLLLVGVVNIPIIHFSVEWWNTLHQPASVMKFGAPSVHPAMLRPLLLMSFGFLLFAMFVVLLRAQAALLRREAGAKWTAAWTEAKAP